MGKIFYVMGKSASGKDTIYRELQEREILALRTVKLYTTRPIRDGEKTGEEYYFANESIFKQMLESDKIIEFRTYHTAHGDWTYYTADDGQIKLDEKNASYLMIGTLESFARMQNYYGEQNLIPIYVEVEDGIRLFRALQREQAQREPKYKELCRRFLADEEDFSEDNMKRCKIGKKYYNINLDDCIGEIEKDIRNYKDSML